MTTNKVGTLKIGRVERSRGPSWWKLHHGMESDFAVQAPSRPALLVVALELMERELQSCYSRGVLVHALLAADMVGSSDDPDSAVGCADVASTALEALDTAHTLRQVAEGLAIMAAAGEFMPHADDEVTEDVNITDDGAEAAAEVDEMEQNLRELAVFDPEMATVIRDHLNRMAGAVHAGRRRRVKAIGAQMRAALDSLEDSRNAASEPSK